MSKINETTYIYGLVEPHDGRIRYVGRADNPQRRYQRHLQRLNGHSHKVNWIKHLLSLGLRPSLVYLAKVPKSHWAEAEQFQIAFFRERGFDLTNSTDGGDGRIGHKMSEEAKRKLSEYWKGRKRPSEVYEKISQALKGRPLSAEARLHQSEAQKRRFLKENSPTKGKKLSDETRAKIRKARKDQIITQEHRRNISKALSGKKKPPRTVEHRRRLSEARKQILLSRKLNSEQLKLFEED